MYTCYENSSSCSEMISNFTARHEESDVKQVCVMKLQLNVEYDKLQYTVEFICCPHNLMLLQIVILKVNFFKSDHFLTVHK